MKNDVKKQVENEPNQVKINAKIPAIISVIGVLFIIFLIIISKNYVGDASGWDAFGRAVLLILAGGACILVMIVSWFIWLIILTIKRKQANLRNWYAPLIVLLIVIASPGAIISGARFIYNIFPQRVIINFRTKTIDEFNIGLFGSYKIKGTNISVERNYLEYGETETKIYINKKDVLADYRDVYLDVVNDKYIFYVDYDKTGNLEIYVYDKNGSLITHLDQQQIGSCNYINYDKEISIYKMFTTNNNQTSGMCSINDLSNYCSNSDKAKVYQRLDNSYELVDNGLVDCTGKEIDSKDFIHLESYNGEEQGIIVFKDYKEFSEKIKLDVLTAQDFINNNYALFQITYDGCSESDIRITNYDIDDQIIVVNYTYKAGCGVCAPIYDTYLVRVEKNISALDLKLNGTSRNKTNCDPNVSYKPMIYLYPTEKTNVTVNLGYPELLTTTYPKYTDKWDVVAYPNGNLIDKNHKTYYGLYWEGLNSIKTSFPDGFVVKKEDTISFLEDKLSILGLNEKEANEFIIYWLPILEQNEYNLIRFESLEEINNQMPLDIKPTPDTVIRVLMEYKPINKKIKIKEQQLTTPTRKGFAVVEWGGTIIK